MRELLRELDPVHAARSTLEVKTRRLLVAHGINDFERDTERWSIPARHGFNVAFATGTW